MAIVYFVNPQYLEENLPVSKNVDPRSVFQHVNIAEQRIMQLILGSDQFADLKYKYSAVTINPTGTTQLSTDESVLIYNYIKPAVAWTALEIALPFLNQQIKEKGNLQQYDEFSQVPDLAHTQWLLTQVEKNSGFFQNTLQDYLHLNEDLYPIYKAYRQKEVIKKNPKQGWNKLSIGFY